MPNWCHNVLTVEADDPADLERFVEAVREPLDDEYLRDQYDHLYDDGAKPSYEEWKAKREANRSPLSFQAIAPYRAEDWPDLTENCRLCGGTGRRPDAERFGADWIKRSGGCNGCGGAGSAVPFGEEGWYRHHLERWGTKWDAAFGGGRLALGEDGMDLAACVEANGVVLTPTVAIYRFDTAWSPPTPAILAASEQYPGLTLTLRFGEPGEGFAGVAKYVAGVEVESQALAVEDVLAPEERWF